jgi:HD-GYP domain-containing protein (c-di-GMP phosphodiesterase class II)
LSERILSGTVFGAPDRRAAHSTRGEVLPLRRVAVGPEIEGLYVARTVYDESGRHALIRRGARLEPSLIRAMLRREIRAVWVSNELLPDLEVPEVVREETRRQVRTALQQVLMAAERERLEGPGLERLREAVVALVDEILENGDVVANMNQLRAFDTYTFEHSVQVAMISVLVGRELGLKRRQLYRLGTGSILHDIGKVAVPKEILTKPGRLTPEEFARMQEHCEIGWQLLQDEPAILPTAAIVVLQHHERLDGSGYPKGLRDGEIHLYSRIAAVADVFDAMRADREYRARLTPPQIVGELTAMAGPKLEAQAVAALLRRVAVVSQGEIVRLSDGGVAVVVRHRPGHPLAPDVVLAGDAQGRPTPPVEVALANHGLEVAEVLREWPPTLREALRLPRRR